MEPVWNSPNSVYSIQWKRMKWNNAIKTDNDFLPPIQTIATFYVSHRCSCISLRLDIRWTARGTTDTHSTHTTEQSTINRLWMAFIRHTFVVVCVCVISSGWKITSWLGNSMLVPLCIVRVSVKHILRFRRIGAYRLNVIECVRMSEKKHECHEISSCNNRSRVAIRKKRKR